MAAITKSRPSYQKGRMKYEENCDKNQQSNKLYSRYFKHYDSKLNSL